MTSFRFLHASDIHLDSPLHGLSRYDGLPVEEIRSATRAAFDNLIDCAIREDIDFVVISGDLFDGDWRDMGTGLYFARAMGKLDKASIPVFILSGNHDAASIVTRTIPWPPNVRRFGSRKPESFHLTDLAVAVHGQSFSTGAVTDNMALAYPPADDHFFNIGVLHTALTGRQGHADYAPCSVEDLRSRGYDYWALGHVHQFEIVSTDPYVVFPGNLQGRKINETGPKGAVIVSVVDGQVAGVERVELDVIRWVALDVDCSGSKADELTDLLRSQLNHIHGANGSGRPLVARINLVGKMVEAGRLLDRAPALREDVRAIAASISPDLYVEKVQVRVSEPRAKDGLMFSGDLDALISEAASHPNLAATLKADLDRFLVAADTALGKSEDGALRLLASQGDFPAIIQTASVALRSRLIREA